VPDWYIKSKHIQYVQSVSVQHSQLWTSLIYAAPVHQVIWTDSVEVCDTSLVGLSLVLRFEHLHFKARSQNWEQLLLASSCLSVWPSVSQSVRLSAWNSSLPLDGFSWNLFWSIVRQYVENIKFSLKSDKMTALCMKTTWRFFFIISLSVLLKMINVSDNSCRGNQNTFCVQWLFFENRAVYEITWKNIVEWSRPQMTIWRIHIACWTPKAINTHTHRMCNTHCSSTCTNAPQCYVIVHWSHASREPACFGKRPIVQTTLFNRCWIFHSQTNNCCKVLCVDNFCLKCACSFLPEITWKHIACTRDNNSL
jgi:hypothetical protein